MDISPNRETYAQADHSWLGSSHGTDSARTVTIDVSTLTAETHYPNGYLPDGTPLGELAAGLYGVYDGDDPDTLAGFLLEPVKVTEGGSDVAGALLEHGRVIEANLPIEIDANGIADVAGQIIIITAGGGS